MITHFLYVFQYVEENEMEVIMIRSFAVHGKIFKERCFFFSNPTINCYQKQ